MAKSSLRCVLTCLGPRCGRVVVETCHNMSWESQRQGKGENTLQLAFGAREGVVWGCVIVEMCCNTSQGQGKGGNTLRLAFGVREGVVLALGLAGGIYK